MSERGPDGRSQQATEPPAEPPPTAAAPEALIGPAGKLPSPAAAPEVLTEPPAEPPPTAAAPVDATAGRLASATTAAGLPPAAADTALAQAAGGVAPEPSAADDAQILAALKADVRGRAPASFRYTRWVFLRALGFIYVVAFAIVFNQALALIGSQGLLPATRYLERLKQMLSFEEHPTLFWFVASDAALSGAGTLGLLLALLMLAGVDHVIVTTSLWVLYISFVHVGQIFYGYGWETLLLETGFLAIFLSTVRTWTSLRDPRPIPRIMFVWLGWLLFRLMFGAGMIKLRGDSCWRDLTCMYYHYETQPNPHPLSRYFHFTPHWFHQFEVLFNHFVELIVPFGLLVPRLRNWAAFLTIFFQTVLIFSGNLSFLNWLTIAVAVGCIDDRVWLRVLPQRLKAKALPLAAATRSRVIAVGLYSCLVALLSIEPALNLLSRHQQMNSSFEPLHLVNTYGAFGSIGRERDEVIVEGTDDADPRHGHYREYEFKCKPGAVNRAPCLITPYHYRLDWQMWFAALSTFERQPWLANLIWKLLHNDAHALSLIASNPFPDKPPRFIRAERYRYHFAELGSDRYWKRERIGTYAPAIARDDPRLRQFLASYGLSPSELRVKTPSPPSPVQD